MNSREWKQFASGYLLPRLPGFMLSGRWLCYAPIGWQVRGFAFKPSRLAWFALHPPARAGDLTLNLLIERNIS